jgi:hypothetical protein
MEAGSNEVIGSRVTFWGGQVPPDRSRTEILPSSVKPHPPCLRRVHHVFETSESTVRLPRTLTPQLDENHDCATTVKPRRSAAPEPTFSVDVDVLSNLPYIRLSLPRGHIACLRKRLCRRYLTGLILRPMLTTVVWQRSGGPDATSTFPDATLLLIVYRNPQPEKSLQLGDGRQAVVRGPPPRSNLQCPGRSPAKSRCMYLSLSGVLTCIGRSMLRSSTIVSQKTVSDSRRARANHVKMPTK